MARSPSRRTPMASAPSDTTSRVSVRMRPTASRSGRDLREARRDGGYAPLGRDLVDRDGRADRQPPPLADDTDLADGAQGGIHRQGGQRDVDPLRRLHVRSGDPGRDLDARDRPAGDQGAVGLSAVPCRAVFRIRGSAAGAGSHVPLRACQDGDVPAPADAYKRDRGASLIGRTVKVWTSDSYVSYYRITAVRKVSNAMAGVSSLIGDRLRLQTSTGPNSTYPKLIVDATRYRSVRTTYAAAHPKAHPISC